MIRKVGELLRLRVPLTIYSGESLVLIHVKAGDELTVMEVVIVDGYVYYAVDVGAAGVQPLPGIPLSPLEQLALESDE